MKIVESKNTNLYKYEVAEDSNYKIFESDKAHYVFDKKTGIMMSWGETMTEDPQEFPVPTILDLEVSTKCNKPVPCKFCYKSNTHNGDIMSLDTFKKIIDTMSRGLTQVALGSGYYGIENPYIFDMMDYARLRGIIPNVTVGCVREDLADAYAKRVGAIAISRYEDSVNDCYNSVKRMTDRGITQTNIHYMICEETYKGALQTLEDAKTDPRLKKLNAIVFLSLKTKGRGNKGFTPLSQDKFDNLVNKAKEYNIGIGFDSCSSLKAFKAYKGDANVSKLIEPCESGSISSYINVKGIYYPCSFAEGTKTNNLDWSEGIDVLSCKDTDEFLTKVWYNKKTKEFRKALQESRKCNEYDCRECPLYNV